MKKYQVIAIFLSILFILISVGILIYDFYFASQIIIRPMYLVISSNVGVNTNTDALNFGKNRPGGISIREVNISNIEKYPVSISIRLTGDLAKYVAVSDNDFILDPGAIKHLSFYAQTPISMPYGNFTGVATIVVNRVLFK